MLSLINVNKRIKGRQILNDISYEFQTGVYGLLGPNGAGKTTLIRCVTGLYTAQKGTIQYRENPICASNIGYLPQKFGLFRDLTVYEMMQIMANIKRIPVNETKENIIHCVEMVNLSDRLNSKIKALSGGMIRRLGIAQVLLGDPEIMIFDEPTTGLDPEERMNFKLLVSQIKKDKLILISTHIVSDVEAISDHVLVLNQGQLLAAGNLMEISKHAENKVYIVPEQELQQFQSEYWIQGKSMENGMVQCRILSAKLQDFPQGKPTLEDGYMCLIKGI